MCLQVVFLAFILLRIYRNSWTLVSNFSSVLQNPHLVSFYTLLKYYLFFLSSLFLGPNSLYTRPFYNLPHISLFCFFLYLYFLFLRLSYFRPSAMYILPLGPSITFLTFPFSVLWCPIYSSYRFLFTVEVLPQFEGHIKLCLIRLISLFLLDSSHLVPLSGNL